MKHSKQNNSAHRSAPRKRQQLRHHVGPAGLRHYTRELAEYDVPGIEDSERGPGVWRAHFVAGDLLCIVAGQHHGGPVEIAVFDGRGHALVISKVPGGLCRAGTKVHFSGVHSVRVRYLEAADDATSRGGGSGKLRLAGAGMPASSEAAGCSAPFKLCRTRERPQRLRARMAPRRRPVHPRFVMSPVQRLLRQLFTGLSTSIQHLYNDRRDRERSGLRDRLDALTREESPATAA